MTTIFFSLYNDSYKITKIVLALLLVRKYVNTVVTSHFWRLPAQFGGISNSSFCNTRKVISSIQQQIVEMEEICQSLIRVLPISFPWDQGKKRKKKEELQRHVCLDDCGLDDLVKGA